MIISEKSEFVVIFVNIQIFSKMMPIYVFSFLLAIFLDCVFSDPPNWCHPVALMGLYIRSVSGFISPKSSAGQFLYGGAIICFGVLIFSLPWFLLNYFLQSHSWIFIILNGFLLKFMFSIRSLNQAGVDVVLALEDNDLLEARRLTSWHFVSRKTDELNESYVSSAVIESLSENVTDSFLAPFLAFVIGGLPFVWLYRFVNTADAMIGYHNPSYEYLGKFAARFDDILNYIPARLAGLFIILAAWNHDFNVMNAWHVMISQNKHTLSPNAGWPMSAAAGALDINLEKMDHYLLQGGSHLPSYLDISRALTLINRTSTWVIIFSLILLLVKDYVF